MRVEVSGETNRGISQELHSKKVSDGVVFLVETEGAGIRYLWLEI
jgi:hypothetical protein